MDENEGENPGPGPTHNNSSCKTADGLSSAFLLHGDAAEADQAKELEAAFWLYRQAAQLQTSEVLTELPELRHYSSTLQQISDCSSRALELQKQLEVKVPESGDSLTVLAQAIIGDLVLRLPACRTDSPLTVTSHECFANTPWLSALVTGSSEQINFGLATAASAASATSSNEEAADVEVFDVEDLISAATVARATNQSKNCDGLPRLLIAELMLQPDLLILRRIDRLFVSDISDGSRVSSAMLTELLVRVHALRCRTNGCVKNVGVKVGRSRLLATAAKADEIPASARRRLFDLIV